jgi:ribosomal-protein-alanine N-acetyltransferase
MLNFIIRAAQKHDLSRILAIETMVDPSPWSEENFVAHLSLANLFWVIEEAGNVIGYAVLMMIADDEAELLKIVVLPEKQGQGLGGNLLNRLLQEMHRRSVKKIFLEVRASNEKAIHLYQQAGFVTTGVRKKYYACKDGAREDAILFTHFLEKLI